MGDVKGQLSRTAPDHEYEVVLWVWFWLKGMQNKQRAIFFEALLACAGLPTCKNCYITCLATMLSESLLCHNTAVEVSLCLVLYCAGDLNPLLAELPW